MHNEEQEEKKLKPVWQDHERRITKLEVEQQMFIDKLDSLETVVVKESSEQKGLLNKLIDHHLSTNKIKLSNFWKLLLNVTGATGLLVVVIYALIEFLKG